MKIDEPIRVLQVLGSLNLGGAESRIMDLYRKINRQEIQFDFLIHAKEPQYFEEEVKSLGGKVYRLPRFKGYNYMSYKKAVKNFFREHREFACVHGHMTSTAGIYLPIAKKYGVPMTIAHARSAGTDKGIKGQVTKYLRRNLKEKTDYCFTCSALAGQAVFGEKAQKEGRVQILPNAIDASKCTFDADVRNRMRQELGVENKFVIGHVGRFDFMKNHTFLLDIFEEIVAMGEDAVLLLLGDGKGREQIEKLALEKGLQDRVLFQGNRKNVHEYLQAMDYFVFPSLFEGLPGTVVEAQAAGLKCLISDTITNEVGFSDLVRFFSLEKIAKAWGEYVLQTKEYVRENTFDMIKKAGFDVNSQAENMAAFYKTSKKKKLMLMVPSLRQGGLERVCALTARMLLPYYQIFLCVFNLEDAVYDVKGISVLHLNMGARKGKLGKVLQVLNRCRKVSFWKKQLGVDVTYSFGPTANLVNVLSKIQGESWCGIRSYMDMHPSNNRNLQLFVKRSDKIISCSKVIEEELRQKFHCESVETLYNPYDREWIMTQAKEKVTDIPWKKEEVFTLVSMGREDDIKGFWHLMKSFSLVEEKYKQVRLMIIGDGEFKEYRELAKKLSIEDKIYFAGLKKNPFPYLAFGQVYVLTSYNEGFPNALVEAMTLSLPVIATDCLTGPAEILQKAEETQNGINYGEYGMLIPNMSPDKNLEPGVREPEEEILAEAICRLLENQELYHKYVEKAQERSAFFGYEGYTKQFQTMMES